MTGFDFSNYNRNAALQARGAPGPKATSTGTTIVGCIYDNGVVVRTPPAIGSFVVDEVPSMLTYRYRLLQIPEQLVVPL
ncbi:hypothetical protein BJX63DRAFT_345832 [Aspergillus granulosus]|uniref:Uncharacterized protein n=1 Tax=Aspergillus granulosus TaxID=176169 RepID=A0ABR4H2H4_9EURO